MAGTIEPLTPLPALTDDSGGTIVDGSTAPGYVDQPVVILSGPGIGTSSIGLTITSSFNEVQALQINGFDVGIEILGADALGNRLIGNYGPRRKKYPTCLVE